MYALMIWYKDDPVQGTVVTLASIVEPRKALNEYYEGERVRCRCPGHGIHPGIVGKVSEDRKALQKILEGKEFSQVVEKSINKEEVRIKTQANLTNCASKETESSSKETESSSKETKSSSKETKSSSKESKSVSDEINSTSNETNSASEETKSANEETTFLLTKKRLYRELEPLPSLPSEPKKFKVDHLINDPSSNREVEALQPKKEASSNTCSDEVVKKINSLKDRVRELEKWKREVEKRLPSVSVSASAVVPASATPPSPPSCSPKAESASLYNGKTFQFLQDCVSHTDDVFSCVQTLLKQLFTDEYIVCHSVSGQRANSHTLPKPKFDSRLFEGMTAIVRQKFPNVSKSEITLKVQAVQKKLKKSVS